MMKYFFLFVLLVFHFQIFAQQKTYIDETKVISLNKLIETSVSDTISLKNDNYFVLLNRPVILQNKKYIFRSAEKKSFIYLDGSFGFDISENSTVVFEGITFKNSRYSSHASDSALFFRIKNSNVTFSHCRFESISTLNFGKIIGISGSASILKIDNSTFVNCTFKSSPSVLMEVSDSSVAELNRVIMKSNYAASGNAFYVSKNGLLKINGSTLINKPVDSNPANVLISGDGTGHIQLSNSILFSYNNEVFSDNLENISSSFSFISFHSLSLFENISGYNFDSNLLQPNSNLVDSGNPEISDPDGTRSDIGASFYDQTDLISKLKAAVYKPTIWIISSFIFLGFVFFQIRKSKMKGKNKGKTNDSVQVFLFGKFEIICNGENKTDRLSKDQQELFIGFILKSLMINQAVNLEDIILTLWPDDEYKTNKNTRNQIIKRLRDRLEILGCFRIESEGKKLYRMTSSSSVWIDYWELLSENLQNAKDKEDILKRGPLLPGFTSDFFEKEREKLEKFLRK